MSKEMIQMMLIVANNEEEACEKALIKFLRTFNTS